MTTMKLYVCWGTFKIPAVLPGRPHGHVCEYADTALREAGYDPEVIKAYGLGPLPDWINSSKGRKEVRKLSPKGSSWVPLLVTDDGEVIQGSQRIVDWAKANPA